MKSVRFNRLAERELAEAVEHYEAESPGLGDRFLDEVWHALALLVRHPEAAPRIRGSIRRFVLPRFPYSLMYRPDEKGNGIRVLAVAHQRRHPEYWAGRR
jgi:plasmid stabilization system protein ParE